MPIHSQGSGRQRFALGLLLVVIALIGAVVYQLLLQLPLSPPPAQAAAASKAVGDEAQVRVVDGVVKFYFATGKADIAIGGNAALANVVRGVMTGKRARISGFHDGSGDAVANAALAKQRAMAVHSTLLSLGVDEKVIELQKPAQTQASGSPAEARRVEVMLID